MATPKSKAMTAPRSWRDLYPPHPCADVFPMMSDAEFNELAKDIKEHGLQHSVLLLRIGTKHSVLDGRNRLEALARLGVEFVADPIHVDVPPRSAAAIVFETIEVKDPATFVISANIRRRHLTKEQQAELVAKTVEAGRAKNDSAKVARSFSPTTGRKGGSTKDPVLAKAVAIAKQHGISKRTVERAYAKVRGTVTAPRKRTPNSSPTPTTLPTRRVDMVVGSPEWAKATVNYAKTLWQHVESSEDRWREVVGELETGRAWTVLGHPALDDLLVKEIGVTAPQKPRAAREKRPAMSADAGVVIDSGPVVAADRAEDVPRTQWPDLGRGSTDLLRDQSAA